MNDPQNSRNMTDPRQRLIVALDVPSLAQAEALVDKLIGRVGMFKIGLELFTAVGPAAIQAVTRRGAEVFYDSKLLDIPNTVAGAARRITALGVRMFNVHTLGGRAVMEAAKRAAGEQAAESSGRPPLVLGVTVLTSLDERALAEELGLPPPLEGHVLRLARAAQDAGLDGVVASAREARSLRAACGTEFCLVTPGIRPKWAAGDDQRRVMEPRAALEAGADYLVIGRPITAADDPAAAAERILAEL